MGKAKAKLVALASVAVTIRQGEASPVQAAAWARLWKQLMNPEKETAPAPGGDDRGGDMEADDDELKPPTRSYM